MSVHAMSIDPRDYLSIVPSPSMNCWDFVCKVFETEFNIQLQRYWIGCPEDMLKVAMAETSKLDWIRETTAACGDVVLMNNGTGKYHAGVMVDTTNLMHLVEKAGVRVVPLSQILKQTTKTTIFRHANLH